MISTMTIDLSTQPDMRWNLTPQDKADLNTLLDDYLQDLSVDDSLLDLIQAEYIQNVPQEYKTEIEALADIAQRPLVELVVANLYYDLVKLVLGCTAFVAATPSGPIHGRNLDWFSNQRRLSRTTRQLNFINNPAGDFSIVGWPGAIGALSGIAYGRFSITLNAVASDESITPGLPVALLIRHVLQYARDYEQAIEWLSQTDIPCDCLLLVCGVNNEQMLVIERTPKKYALRPGVNGRLAVTNDYRIMKAKSEVDETNVIASTSCWRYRRITSLLEREIPMTAEQCFRYLSDEKVIMQITEQQMVFQPATDFLEVRKISI